MVEKKNEMHGDVPVSDIVKDDLISEIYFRILFIFKRYNVLQIFFVDLVMRKVRLFTNKQDVLTLLHLR